MSSSEQKKIKQIATKFIKNTRSREQIINTLKNAGIVDKDGEIKSPYNQVLVKK